MQVTHAGYKDPNNLKFEDVTILGMLARPGPVSVTHFSTAPHGNSTTTLPDANINYDVVKKVKMSIDIFVHKCKIISC